MQADDPTGPSRSAHDPFANDFAVAVCSQFFDDPVHGSDCDAEQRRQFIDGKLAFPMLGGNAVQLEDGIDADTDFFRDAKEFFVDAGS